MSALLNRRRALSATLSDAQDGSVMVAALGHRLRRVQWETRLGAGYHELTAQLLSLGGKLDLPQSEADEAFRLWRLCVLRVQVTGEQVWFGRITKIERTAPKRSWWRGEPTRQVTLTSSGRWIDYTLLPPDTDADYTDEGATTTLSDVVRAFTKQIRSISPLVQSSFDLVEPTSVNIGPLRVSVSDRSLDLINSLAKTASAGGDDEKWFGLYDDPGPILRSRKQPASYRHALLDSELGDAWDVNEYASRSIASYTDENGSSATTELSDDDEDALALHNGIPRQASISLDKAQADGALAGRDSYLSEHIDPVGFTGTLKIAPKPGQDFGMLETFEGGLVPNYRARAGEVVELYGELGLDPYFQLRGRLRSYVIEATKYDLDSGTLEITPESRALRSRPNERHDAFMAALRVTEPSSALGISIKRASAKTLTVAKATNVELSDDAHDPALLISVRPTARTTLKIHAHVFLDGSSGTDDAVYIGYSLDSENWDYTDSDRSSGGTAFNAADNDVTLDAVFFRTVTPGAHTIHFWVRGEGSANYSATQARIVVDG